MNDTVENPETLEPPNRVPKAIMGGMCIGATLVAIADHFREARALPLIWLGSDSAYKPIFLCIMFSAFGAVALFPNRRATLSVIGLKLALLWLLFYSAMGAFEPVAALAAFLFFLVEHDRRDRIQAQAAWFMALIFVFAAFQKLNVFYLKGEEFLPSSAFLYYLVQWGFSGFAALSQELRSAVALLSVGTELAIGTLVLFFPRVGIQLVALFVLILASVHPPVFYVYCLFLPFVWVIDDKMAEAIDGSKWRRIVRSRLAWAIFYLAFRRAVPVPPLWLWAFKTGPLLIVAALFHVRCLINAWKCVGFRFRVTWPRRKVKEWIVPCAMLASVLAYRLGAPSPLGFSMFSGARDHRTLNSIQFADDLVCGKIYSGIPLTMVVGGIRGVPGGGCQVMFPTLSGLRALAVRVCESNPTSNWELVTKDKNRSLGSCASLF